MKENQSEQHLRRELPEAKQAPWAEFLDPRLAIENFKKMLRKIGEVI